MSKGSNVVKGKTLLFLASCTILLPIALTFYVKAAAPSVYQWLEFYPHYLAFVCIFLGFVGVSRQVLAALCGYLLNFWDALLMIESTMLISACAAYYGGRWVPARSLESSRTRTLRFVIRKLRANPFHGVLLLRLIPVGSNLLTNTVAGILRLPLTAFIAASAIGYLPQHIIFVLAGQGLQIGSLSLLLIASFTFLLSLLFIQLVRKSSNAQKNGRPAQL